ncbi:hypothetical protein VPHD81_0091 [Vibrio phage D81]
MIVVGSKAHDWLMAHSTDEEGPQGGTYPLVQAEINAFDELAQLVAEPLERKINALEYVGKRADEKIKSLTESNSTAVEALKLNEHLITKLIENGDEALLTLLDGEMKAATNANLKILTGEHAMKVQECNLNLQECEMCRKQAVLWRGVCHSCSKKIKPVEN